MFGVSPSPHRFLSTAVGALALFASTAPAWAAQTPLDRADPAVVKEELPDTLPSKPKTPLPTTVAPDADATVDVGGGIVAGAIRVEGATILQPAAFAPVIERYAGRELSSSDLAALASDVANVARRAGYGLATAWIPAQRLGNGVLRVVIDEGRIDAVEASGKAASVAERYLAALVGTGPVSTRALERRLLVAGDIAGVTVGNARLERQDGRNILKVATDRDRVRGRASLDNWGTAEVGPVRAQANVDLSGVGSDDDRLSLGAAITPFEPREFGLVSAEYTMPLGTNGTDVKLGGYYAYTHPGGVLSGRDFDGHSAEAGAEFSHPLLRTRETSVWAYSGFTLRESVQSIDGAPLRSDQIAILQASIYALDIFTNGYVRGRVAISQGLDIFGATEPGDPLASRDDASGRFGKIDVWGEYVRRVAPRVTMQLQAQAQLATRPLLSSEEMGLGGRSFLRGYDYRELSGDKGIAGSAEVRYDLGEMPKPLSKAQLYLYGDVGSVGNYRGGGGGGTLASAGGGVRVWLGKAVEAGLELGIPLKDGAFGADRDPRLSFTIGTRF
ncbi:ShlB/FhaC/HecB family hemolysin secretion/activation protein [Allosphingosinicella indica]|uniref:Hemolysin activation/secretion protein n=1 Tax=Allosphingosinicella indica TaxID=941907 RepID=A0A1X7GV73_9SPHN|nr:ShlB/FhaC/HecB family hemolysin secretion/activation protein [Allosphingosinicella indica]SMF75156.1 Hemolysin activation/secretion protein [Allosphingosinicella indica]